MPTSRGMGHHFDPNADKVLRLSPRAHAAREQRVLEVKALVEAGLYRVDAGSLARAMCKRARVPLFARAGARSLDMVLSA